MDIGQIFNPMYKPDQVLKSFEVNIINYSLRVVRLWLAAQRDTHTVCLSVYALNHQPINPHPPPLPPPLIINPVQTQRRSG